MQILVLILLALFCIAAFVIIYVVMDNKNLKEKAAKANLVANSADKSKVASANKLSNAYEGKIARLRETIIELSDNNSRMKVEIGKLVDEVKNKSELIEQLKSVAICERAFLIDMEE